MKKENFVVGQWYRGYTPGYFIKFLSLEPRNGYNKINYSEKVEDGLHTIGQDYWANDEMGNFALENPVFLEELLDFLPKNHPDRANLLPKEDPEAMNIIKNLLL